LHGFQKPKKNIHNTRNFGLLKMSENRVMHVVDNRVREKAENQQRTREKKNQGTKNHGTRKPKLLWPCPALLSSQKVQFPVPTWRIPLFVLDNYTI